RSEAEGVFGVNRPSGEGEHTLPTPTPGQGGKRQAHDARPPFPPSPGTEKPLVVFHGFGLGLPPCSSRKTWPPSDGGHDPALTAASAPCRGGPSRCPASTSTRRMSP